jgi:hypothetical protein
VTHLEKPVKGVNVQVMENWQNGADEVNMINEDGPKTDWENL